MALVLTVVDCEAVRSAWPAQPVNAWSSLAFVAVGALVATRGRTLSARLIGAATVLVGVGSLLFHGDDGDFSGWIHDWSIAALLLLLIPLAGREATVRPWVVGLFLVGTGALIWFAPGLGEWVNGGLAATVAVRELLEWPARATRPMAVAVVLAGAGGVLTILGRTGGVWCSPETLLQPHAGWHILAGAALGFYAAARGWLRRMG